MVDSRRLLAAEIFPVIDGDMIYAHWWEAGGESETATETPTFAEMPMPLIMEALA